MQNPHIKIIHIICDQKEKSVRVTINDPSIDQAFIIWLLEETLSKIKTQKIIQNLNL